ncbi:hypothetical protein [Neisseria sp.]|uniref:hypothetical protein n=1 Tax=Neisseria sp. TaxID=192066 RepID=UPI0035A03E26
MEITLSQWQKKLLLWLFNGKEVNDGRFVVGYILAPHPFSPEEHYRLPPQRFYKSASLFCFRYWVIGEFIRFTFHLHLNLLCKSLYGAIIFILALGVINAFLASQSEYKAFIDAMMVQQNFQHLYKVSFFISYAVHLAHWVITYSSNRFTFIYFLRCNWRNLLNSPTGLSNESGQIVEGVTEG